MHFSAIFALTSAIAVQAVNQGFNYGATFTDGSVKQQQDFQNEFTRAKNLQGTSGFTSARLYTMIQGGTADTVSSAIPAAINTKTTLLLGLWGSGGQAAFSNEITALTNAINQYGSSFTSLIAGISVGSEDLYRVSPTGIENDSGAGATPDQLVSYISQVRSAISGTAASSALVGHVDTWTAWVNGSNSAVINAVDFLGMDGYPYFETTLSNSISNSASLFFDSYNATVAVAGGKAVWITETGYPVSGPTENLAVPSIANAETYWQEVACRVLGNINTYWYTIQDAYPTTPSPSFGIIGEDLSSAPLYNLTCSNAAVSSSSSTSSSSATASSTAVSATQPSTAPVSATSSIVTTPGAEKSPSSVAVPTSSASSVSGSTTATPSHSTSSMVTSTVIVSGTHTSTIYSTTLVTITSCSASCVTSVASTSSVAPAPAPTTSSGVTTHVSSTSVATSSTSSATSPSGCPANLNGAYEYPHLIVPVDSANPTKVYGTSYNGTISSTISSVFNFDIPASDGGKKCSLVFLFPQKSQLQTSSYSFNGKGGLAITGLSAPATEQTTYNTLPASSGLTASIPSVSPGNSYVVLTETCPAGSRVGFEFSSIGGLELNFFEDYNPSPLGVYITVC